MNETIQLILDRRSVRKFLSTPIEEAAIQEIVQAGMYAPSARNRQNWHFTVVTNPSMIEEMNRLTQTGMETRGIKVAPSDHVFYRAPLVIVVSSLLEGYSEMNAGCAIQNMAIAAKSLGIDSCIIGQSRFMYNQTNKVDIHRMLKVPMDYEHDCSICFGYRDGANPDPKPRREGVVDYLR
jgi:nitroreductase